MVKNTPCTTCLQCGQELCINSIPLLSSLDPKEAEIFAGHIDASHYKKGDYIFHHGDLANKLYIICSGKVKITKTTIEGKEQVLYLLSTGDFIGAFNLLKEDEFDFDAIALEDTQVSTLGKPAFDQVILGNPEITLKVLEKAYERIMKAESLVERLSMNNQDNKVASLLLTLIPSYGQETAEGILLNLTMNRDELGSYAGIARETMSRKLMLFQELGIVELKSSKMILLKDIQKLQEMS